MVEGGGIGENIREYWTNSRAIKTLMPTENSIGRSNRNIILDLERKANELDRMLQRELALGINGRSFYGIPNYLHHPFLFFPSSNQQ
jgi:hypothetical protein